MKIIKPSILFYGEVPTDYEGAMKFIADCGHLCYKSESLEVEGFVKKLIKAGHLAMVEHSNFVVKRAGYDRKDLSLGKYLNDFYDEASHTQYIGGSITAWYQRAIVLGMPNFTEPFMEVYSGIFEDLFPEGLGNWQICPHNEIPHELHRYAAKFICDRGVSHELVRHRPCSFAQESTRYVNYGRMNMEFIEPWWMDGNYEENGDDPGRDIFLRSCRDAENNYNAMMDIAVYNSPQSCRAVLPNALKTEIVVTADAAEWAHIRKLRTHPSAHPDMVRVMNMMPWDFLEEK